MRNKINDQILKIRNIKTEINDIFEKPKTKIADNVEFSKPISRFFETEKKTLKTLKIAAIMDRFTLECFKPECELLQVTPQNWLEEIENFKPDLFFLESAWEGKDKLWHTKVNRCSDELVSLTDFCLEKNIPVVFWC